MKILKEEVEREGLKLSVTEDWKEGTNKMIASCGFLEDELRQFSGEEEGVTIADSVDSLGFDLRTRVKIVGVRKKKREDRSVGSDSRSSRRIDKSLSKELYESGVKKLLRAGMMPPRTWEVHALGMAPTERLKLRRQMAAAAGKKEYDFSVLIHGSIWL